MRKITMKQAVEQAADTMRLEGIEVTARMKNLLDKVINQDITIEDAIKMRLADNDKVNNK